jgi:acyl-CoA synthetase (AMP-forming)/AMP-acid ligase II
VGALDTFNLADVWEAVVPRVADREALVCDGRRLTYAQVEARANQLADFLREQGVGPGDHIGLYLVNGPEYLEAMLAAFKLRAVPINVNHRYVAEELRYLFDDADVVGVLYQRELAPRLAAIVGGLPAVRWCLAVGQPAEGASADGDGDGLDEAVAALGDREYEATLAGRPTEATYGPRTGDDPYVIYTGGTTGLPKGVVWRQEDAFFACIGGGDPMRLQGPVDEPGQLFDRIVDGTFTYLPVAPLMHAAGQWTALSWLFAGGRIVLLPGSLDPVRVWRTVEEEGVNLLTVVGDPVVRPLLDAWEAAGPFDVSTLFSIGSGGAPLSPTSKDRLMGLLPGVGVVDGFGSSETGAQGSQRLEVGATSGGVTQFTPYGESTTVLDEATLRPVEPGSGVIGRVARRGRIPQGYYGDPEKTAATFVEHDGDRWVLTGDLALVEGDGTVTLLGRGSQCVNTGGEKVFPEEVEGVLKSHPAVYDVLVVGADDARWGQRVVAVVQPVPGTSPSLDELAEHCRAQLAGYKVPRGLVLVDQVERSPAGKADYRWARATAEGRATPTSRV